MVVHWTVEDEDTEWTDERVCVCPGGPSRKSCDN